MKSQRLTYFPRRYANNAILTFFVIMVLIYLLFWRNGLPGIWLAFAVVECLGFFLALNGWSRQWAIVSSSDFERKIFGYSLLIRLVWVIFSYFFYQYQTGKPFMFDASDSHYYHSAASQIALFGFDEIGFLLPGVGWSDLGFPIYLSLIYSVFGDYVIIPRIINAFLGAFTVVLIYRLARRNFGEKAAKLAGIMAVLFPSLIYYCGIHLKETLMMFLLVAFMERADMLLRHRMTWIRLAYVFVLGGLLYFLRSALMASAMFALFSMLFFVRQPGSNTVNRILLGAWVLLIVGVTFFSRIKAELNIFLDYTDIQQQTMRYLSEKEGGNSLAKYGSAVIFAPAVLIAPFPTFVNIEHQKAQMMMSGGYLIKNVLAFFVLFSLVSFVRERQLRKYILILSFMLAYLAILVQSTFALSERFHLPIIPFFLILAGYGITRMDQKSNRYFMPYLILLVVMVIGWSIFKLAGRGMI